MTEIEVKKLSSGNTLYYYGNSDSSFTNGKCYVIQGFNSGKTKILINNVWVENKDIIGKFGLVPEGQKIIPIPEGYRVKNYNDKEIILDKGSISYEQIANSGISKGEVNYLTVPCSNKEYSKLSAISRLIIVADYLNNGWKPNWDNEKENKYTIYIDRSKFKSGEIIISNSIVNSFGMFYFKTYELAERAVKILGEEVIRKVLQ